jgi:histone H3/H4
MTTAPDRVWRKCSSCKNPIELASRYYVCSVSTCNGQRTGYVFCSISCFERHLPTARHKDAGAIEKQAPDRLEPQSSSPVAESRPQVRVFASQATTASSSPPSAASSSNDKAVPKEVLVIASRLKDYIQARSGYNTSGGVMDVLSDHLRVVCERAIENARSDGRKTVMDRDFQFLKKG